MELLNLELTEATWHDLVQLARLYKKTRLVYLHFSNGEVPFFASWLTEKHPKTTLPINLKLVVSTPLKNMKVRLDHRPNYRGK